jgi:hypothetical protein
MRKSCISTPKNKGVFVSFIGNDEKANDTNAIASSKTITLPSIAICGKET